MTTLAVALAFAAPASGATRYAAPGGGGPAASCPEPNPCSLEVAVEAPAVGSGDQIVLTAGLYALADRLDVDEGISVGGLASAPPVIAAATPGDAAIAIDDPDAELHDLTLIQGAGQPALRLREGLADRLRVRSGGSVACQVGATGGGRSLLRDSVCWSDPAASGASAVSVAQSAAGTRSAVLRNVTAWAAGPGGTGLDVAASGSGLASVAALNVIASGAGDDVAATASAGSTTVVALTTSNFADAVTGGAGTALITPSSIAGNQTAEPELVDPAAGRFDELAGSATIDAGSEGPMLGDRALSGEPRIQGPAPDIGADERDGTAPKTAIESGPAQAVSLSRVTFTFRADEPGSAFACRFDDEEYRPCASPFTSSSLGQGDHVFAVRATDPSGNVEPTPAEWRFTIDRVIDGANASARSVQRLPGRRVAVAVEVRAGELARAQAAGTLRVGDARFPISSGRVTLVAGGAQQLRLLPSKRRAARKIARQLRRGQVGEAQIAVTFTDALGNRATSGAVDVRVRARR